MSTMERNILEELVYERVRASVNLCQLVVIEQELEESIQRVVDESPVASDACAPDAEADTLAHGYVQKAWDRVQREWHDLREDLGGLGGSGVRGDD